MILFKYPAPGNWTFTPWTLGSIWHSAEPINGYTTATWIERYRSPGEFSITAPLSSGLRDFLPIGTVISHQNTLEMMFVEDHSIKETEDNDTELVISGRSFEIIADWRVVGADRETWEPGDPDKSPFENLGTLIELQVKQLLVDLFVSTPVLEDEFPDVQVENQAPSSGIIASRTIRRGSAMQRAYEMLALGDMGIKCERANGFDGSYYYAAKIIIHTGNDKTGSVTFSSVAGDIESSSFLWTNRDDRTAALVSGKWVELPVYGPDDPGFKNYNRKFINVDAQDIDGFMNEVPSDITDPTLDQFREMMRVRGEEVLASHKPKVLADAVVSDNHRYRYRVDFNIGDRVNLDTVFGETMVMKVVEYAEIEDQNGERGYPTLAAPEYYIEYVSIDV